MTRHEQHAAFVTAWFQFRTLAEVAAACGMDRRATSNLAASLRRHGIILPPKPTDNSRPGKPEPVDYPALRDLAERLHLNQQNEQGAAEGERYRRGA